MSPQHPRALARYGILGDCRPSGRNGLRRQPGAGGKCRPPQGVGPREPSRSSGRVEGAGIPPASHRELSAARGPRSGHRDRGAAPSARRRAPRRWGDSALSGGPTVVSQTGGHWRGRGLASPGARSTSPSTSGGIARAEPPAQSWGIPKSWRLVTARWRLPRRLNGSIASSLPWDFRSTRACRGIGGTPTTANLRERRPRPVFILSAPWTTTSIPPNGQGKRHYRAMGVTNPVGIGCGVLWSVTQENRGGRFVFGAYRPSAIRRCEAKSLHLRTR